MPKCDYGCGREAEYEMSNGKTCCSENFQSCPAVRSKNSKSLEEAHDRGDVPTEQLDGNRAWNKGQTYEELFGEDRAENLKSELSEKHSERFSQMSEEELKEFSERVSESLKSSNGNVGGKRPGTNMWRGCWYYNKNEGEKVWLDSSWEKKFAEHLDECGVSWERNTEQFSYTYQDEERGYIPDFYLPDRDTYVEVKGPEKERDKAKWRDFPHQLKVLREEDLRHKGIL